MDTLGLGAHSRVRVCPNPLHGWEWYDWTLARRTGIVQQRCSDWANPRHQGSQRLRWPAGFHSWTFATRASPLASGSPEWTQQPSQVAGSRQVRGFGTRCPLNSQSSKDLRKYLGHAKPQCSCASGSWARPSPPASGLPVGATPVPHCTWGEGAASPNIPTSQSWSASESLIPTKT